MQGALEKAMMKAFVSFHWHGACLLPLICIARSDLINPGLAGQKGDKCVLRKMFFL